MRSDDTTRTDETTRTADVDPEDRPGRTASSSWMGRGWATQLSWPPLYRRENPGEALSRDETPDATGATADPEGEGSWWSEAWISVVILVGVALFLFPEPATSMLGIALILLGVGAWIVDALT